VTLNPGSEQKQNCY